MEFKVQNRRVGTTVIAVLALVQIALGVMRALQLFSFGSDLIGKGLILLPLLGMLAFFRGGFVIAIALLYVMFVYGALMGRGWSRSLGLIAAIVNLLLVLSVMIQGESLIHTLGWSIIPVIMIWYLLTPKGRQMSDAD
jgi:hypothetical protein